MAYGEPVKFDLAVNVIQKVIRSLNESICVGLVTFDVMAEVKLDLQRLNWEMIRNAFEELTTRGVTCIAAGLTEAINMIEKSRLNGEILLLTDGRANLSLNRMSGFEGSLVLEEELLKIAEEASNKHIVIHAVSVGEDAFTQTLSTLSMATKGHYWLAEDFQGLKVKMPHKPLKIEINGLKVHGVPAELPSAQPAWTKESQFLHVSVVSQDLYEEYKISRRAFLINPKNRREARTALISIESECIAAYRARRTKGTDEVRTQKAILIDKSYRDYLSLERNDTVNLIIY